ncbi:DUF6538 domain-containing protein [Tardiphaga sp. 839_C3_N1_4]|uniref:DUF6538 domain-containing protein n=1 Tax=Tardiphaga sp. 839_C3_N1_4 TaxID=3240761 RepID=UPI003F1FA4AA
MALRMTCPTKRVGSDNWFFRKRIPADVRAILTQSPGLRPPRWFKDHISISLGTPDRDTAKAKCPDVAAEVERQIAALRAGPKPLTQKQIAALSGELYKAFAVGLEENPVLTPQQWLRVAAMNEEARQGRYGAVAALGIFQTPDDRRRASMEDRFGKMTDLYLIGRGVITDLESRWKLIERASVDLSKAAEKLAANADGDYRPDTYVKRFPAFEEQAADAPAKSLTALAEAWHKAALHRGVRKRDADRIKSRFEMLIAFLQHDDAGRVTKQDIVRWRDYRLEQKKSVKTINDSDVASFSNVFNWGAERGWLAKNPAEAATIKTKRQTVKNRPEFFTQKEAVALLRHATATVGTKREDPKTTAAKRWVPWLLAYSGARVAEMIQLRKGDLREDPDHGWYIRLTPEAGGIKTNKFCDVPVHEHLISIGFVDFVTRSPKGYLFCGVGKDGTIDGPAGGVYSRLRKEAVTIVGEEDVQPLHAWRYTFKTYGLEAGIQEITLDAISNHAPKHQGGRYTRVTLKARAEAMAQFPRYVTD